MLKDKDLGITKTDITRQSGHSSKRMEMPVYSLTIEIQSVSYGFPVESAKISEAMFLLIWGQGNDELFRGVHKISFV